MAKKDLSKLLAKLTNAERAFLEREFFAPVVQGLGVQVRIEKVRCQMSISPKDFSGWGVFRPLSHSSAQLVRAATMAEREQYLKLFPRVALILFHKPGGRWDAIAASGGDVRVKIEGTVPVRLVEGADQFDTVHARFDGSNFWFEAVDESVDAGMASYLRERLLEMAHPDLTARKGLNAGLRLAYEMCYKLRVSKKEADELARGEYR